VSGIISAVVTSIIDVASAGYNSVIIFSSNSDLQQSYPTWLRRRRCNGC
jgi:hypothetical protein